MIKIVSSPRINFHFYKFSQGSSTLHSLVIFQKEYSQYIDALYLRTLYTYSILITDAMDCENQITITNSFIETLNIFETLPQTQAINLAHIKERKD